MEPSAEPFARIEIRTGCCGFGETWKHVMERFFRTHDVAASIRVNDFGATPGIVAMRLAQALEVGQSDEKPEE
jgi:malonate decarboxylase delta subunit